MKGAFVMALLPAQGFRIHKPVAAQYQQEMASGYFANAPVKGPIQCWNKISIVYSAIHSLKLFPRNVEHPKLAGILIFLQNGFFRSKESFDISETWRIQYLLRYLHKKYPYQ